VSLENSMTHLIFKISSSALSTYILFYYFIFKHKLLSSRSSYSYFKPFPPATLCVALRAGQFYSNTA